MLSAARGLTLIYGGGRPVPSLTPSFRFIGTGNLGGIPLPVVILVAVFALSWFVLARTRFGRYVYAVGGNPHAAKTSGIDVTGIRFSVFVISGALAGLAGMIEVSVIEGRLRPVPDLRCRRRASPTSSTPSRPW